MRIRCPQCHVPMNMVDDRPLSDVSCPSCGTRFGVVGDDATIQVAMTNAWSAADAEKEAGHDTTEDYRGSAKVIGNFQLLNQVGVGAYGSVWKARDKQLDRTVAIKIPRSGQLSEREIENFFREARAAAQIKHPGIVGVHEIGHDGDLIFIVSDFIAGANLQQWLTVKKLSARESAELCLKIANALHAAHEAGVVHRDLKPGNILMDLEGEPHIADFGLAKRDSLDVTMTVDGQILGTPAYMSPEQAAGKSNKADRRSDIYSLGAMMYQLLTGELPFRGASRMLIVQIIKEEPSKPRKLKASVPRDLETICLKCLEKDPNRRYQTAAELAEDLQRYLNGEVIRARPVSKPAQLWRWCRRNPGVAIASSVAVLALIAATVVSIVFAINEGINAANIEKKRRQLQTQQNETARALAQVQEEQKRTRDALKQAEAFSKEATRQAAEAKRQATAAELAQQEEAASRRKAELRLAENHFDMGRSLCELGEVSRGMLWMARSLQLAEKLGNGGKEASEAESLEHAIRVNLSVWRQDMNEVVAFLPQNSEVMDVAFGPDERTALTVGRREMALWDRETGKPVSPQFQAVGLIRCARFSPRGNYIVVGGYDNHARVFDATMGKLLFPPLDHKQQVHSVAIHPEETHFATGTERGVVQVWELNTGKPVGKPMLHESGIESIEFSTLGDRLLTTSLDGTVRLWNSRSGDPIGEPMKQLSSTRSSVFNFGSQKIIAGGLDKAMIWDGNNGKPLATLRHKGIVNVVAFSRSGRIAATGNSDSTTKLWLVDSGDPYGHPISQIGPVHDIEFDGRGNFIATASGDAVIDRGEVRITDIATGKRIGQLLRHSYPVRRIAISPDSKTLISGGYGLQRKGEAWLWKISPGRHRRLIQQYQPGKIFDAIVYSPDGGHLFYGSREGVGEITNAVGPREKGKPILHNSAVYSAAFSADSKMLVVGYFDGSVRRYGVADGKQIGEPMMHRAGVLSVAFDASGQRIVTSSADMTCRLWYADSGEQVVPAMMHTDSISKAVFSPDGKTILTASRDGSARLWLADSGKPVGDPLRHDGPVTDVVFSYGGRFVATSGNDGAVQLWEVETGKPFGKKLAHSAAVNAIAFSPDDRLILTACSDGAARLWQVEDQLRLDPSLQHQGPVSAISFSADGRTAMTGSHDGTAQLWDVATRKSIGSPLIHEDKITRVCFHPSGKQVATGSLDGTARIWSAIPSLLEGDASRIVAWIRVLTGQEIDDSGAVQQLNGTQWQERKKELERLTQRAGE